MSQLQLIAFPEISDPFVNDCFNLRSTRPSASCEKPGMFLVGLFARRLNATVKFLDEEALKSEFSLNSTSQDNIINLIRTGKIDLYSGFFDNATIYGPGVETSLPIYSIETKFVVSSAQKLDGIFAFFTVYSLYTWLGVFGIFLLFLFLSFFVYRWTLVKIGGDGRRVNFKKLNWQLIRLEFLQYEKIQERWLSVNSLVFVFALFNCGFLIQMYSTLITTQVVRPVDPKPFKDGEILKVLKERRYTLLLPTKFRQFNYEFITEKEPAYAELRFALEKTPVEFAEGRNEKGINSLTPVMEKVKSGRYITILSNQAIGMIKRGGYCDFIYYDTNFPSTGRHLLIRQSALLSKINKIILEEQINIRRLHNKYFEYVKYPPECEKTKPPGPKPLKITPFIGVLILLAIGILTGLFSFTVEFLVKKKKK